MLSELWRSSESHFPGREPTNLLEFWEAENIVLVNDMNPSLQNNKCSQEVKNVHAILLLFHTSKGCRTVWGQSEEVGRSPAGVRAEICGDVKETVRHISLFMNDTGECVQQLLAAISPYFPLLFQRMEKIKSKQKSRPSAVDTPAPPVCPEQETLSNWNLGFFWVNI